MFGSTVTLDDRDAAILAERQTALDDHHSIVCGDFVRFADGHMERVSHVWPDGVQTSEGGSWYLGKGYVSFSGGLNQTVPMESLALTDELRPGGCWFFHHDHAMAHNGVQVDATFRVYDAAGVRERVRGLGREWWGNFIPGETVAPLRDLSES